MGNEQGGGGGGGGRKKPPESPYLKDRKDGITYARGGILNVKNKKREMFIRDWRTDKTGKGGYNKDDVFKKKYSLHVEDAPKGIQKRDAMRWLRANKVDPNTCDVKLDNNVGGKKAGSFVVQFNNQSAALHFIRNARHMPYFSAVDESSMRNRTIDRRGSKVRANNRLEDGSRKKNRETFRLRWHDGAANMKQSTTRHRASISGRRGSRSNLPEISPRSPRGGSDDESTERLMSLAGSSRMSSMRKKVGDRKRVSDRKKKDKPKSLKEMRAENGDTGEDDSEEADASIGGSKRRNSTRNLPKLMKDQGKSPGNADEADKDAKWSNRRLSVKTDSPSNQSPPSGRRRVSLSTGLGGFVASPANNAGSLTGEQSEEERQCMNCRRGTCLETQEMHDPSCVYYKRPTTAAMLESGALIDGSPGGKRGRGGRGGRGGLSPVIAHGAPMQPTSPQLLRRTCSAITIRWDPNVHEATTIIEWEIEWEQAGRGWCSSNPRSQDYSPAILVMMGRGRTASAVDLQCPCEQGVIIRTLRSCLVGCRVLPTSTLPTPPFFA